MLRILILLLLVSMDTFAEISIQGLPPAAGLSFTYMETANTNVIRGKMISPGALFLNTQYGYINHPLTSGSDNDSKREIVKGLQTLDLRAGILLRENLNFSLNLSLNSLSMPKSGNHFAMGDSVAQMKYRLTSIYNRTQVALIPELYLPIGSEADYLSTGQMGGAFRVAVARTFNRFKLATNIGFRYLPGATLMNLDYRQQVIAGISSEVILTEKLSLNLEGIGFFSTPYKQMNSTGEMYAGLLWASSPLTTFSAGVSRSGIGNTDNQSVRGIVGFKTYFDDPKKSLPQGEFPAHTFKPQCFIESQNNVFHSRPLNEEEQTRLYKILPYRTGVPLTHGKRTVNMSTLKYGEMSGTVADDFPYVKDSQIPFAIDLTGIPDIRSIKEINHAWLKMRVNKLSQDRRLGTEILCSLNFRLCSGATLEERWHSLLNPNFFQGKGRIVNDRFGQLYLNKPVGEFNGEKLYSKMLTFPLRDLVEGSDVQVKHFFQKTKDGKKTLYFVVADDTFLSNEVSLEVSLGVERCYQKR